MANTISLDPVTGDNYVNAAEAQGSLVVSGTAIGADGQKVTESVFAADPTTGQPTGSPLFSNTDFLPFQDFRPIVTNGVFSSQIPTLAAGQITGHDGTYVITANVIGTDGVAAPQAQETVTVDTIPPAYSTLDRTFTNASGTERVGDTVSFKVGSDSPVIVKGTPELQLSNGQFATYDAATSTATSLNFVYTVKASDNSTADLQIVAPQGQTTGLLLNGGSITDAAGNPFTGDVVGDTFLAVDTTPAAPPPTAPTIALDQVTGDNIVDGTEHQNALPLSGTANGADGQHVTARVYAGPTATGTPLYTDSSAVVTNGAFSGTIPASIVSLIPDGVYTLTADVTGANGVAAQEASETVTVNTALNPPTPAAGGGTPTPGGGTPVPGGGTPAPGGGFDVTTNAVSDIPDQPYTSYTDHYAADGTFLGQTFLNADGTELFSSTYTALPNGGSSYTYSGGSFFDGKTYSSFTDIYDANNNLIEDIQNNRDGSHTIGLDTIAADASGQDVHSIKNDLFANDAPNTRFVFSKGFGHDTIADFQLYGKGHDTLALPATAAGHLAHIIAGASADANGDITLHIDKKDSITLLGIGVPGPTDLKELKALRHDITFQA